MSTRWLVGTTFVVLGASLAVAAPAWAGPEVSTRRLGGPDRYATAAEIARAYTNNYNGASVARGDAFPDALTAVNLGGPTLLTAREELPGPTAEVIRELGLSRVTIVGTEDVVSDRVRQQLEQLGPSVDRVGGRDRYETAAATYYRTYNDEAAVPQRVDGLRTAIMTSGEAYADALAAAPVSSREFLPLVLTARDRLPAPTRAVLQDDPAGFPFEQVVVVGGPTVVSASVVRELEAMGLVVRRVAGATRQETAIKVFEFAEQEFSWRLTHLNLARGDGFADSLAGAPHAGEEEAPILLTVSPTQLGTVTREFLRARSETMLSIDVFGSQAAVSDAVVADARDASTTKPPTAG